MSRLYLVITILAYHVAWAILIWHFLPYLWVMRMGAAAL